ncbi:cytokinin riboside 5'-monophosphate phosphoribohydrolase [Virgibacillus pantothenticus]|uniref:Cytokinin riboside 5'-monophosphate phosphoribohydrolase n=1 Tax=Virgibacillus pantothenticus TaxID=1473 RepID=A0A0L0QLC8_VIRPA|nr:MULTISPECIES: TIGR00730 family Rossman fold protein [Virgibacillus]API91577.1 Rossman fold protein, TIGR00730 family [Virgibacillus sp. 6R]KNE19324.1 lysine decarboxylase [Virgibacillus pantothenticus]MBS7426903.1 TIGR00730 family Rossman fold protein [Virgibacillus sp. 19R1-5]MBU8567637.1 TIGR00730 family Rossman fold protein [Virgibacillus pantothenticus]MBU8602334.1 TIGR00730 family Rossman fold protein [Virgibacillus pantothenticus]
MNKLAVFCGSRPGASTTYVEEATKLGEELAKQNITLVYGGASVGIMGAVADAVLNEGGEVIGVIPEFLKNKEVYHKGLTELIIVDSMHERKMTMANLADGFIALPGGPGTLEEYFEVFTWAQLGLHRKPCGLLNIQHYYDPLLSLFQHMTEQQFMEQKHFDVVLSDTEAKALIEKFRIYEPPAIKTFLKEKQT